jgi:hypothetical protein
MINKLESFFPVAADIPSECLLKAPIHQHETLVGGELKLWAGPMVTVRSAI